MAHLILIDELALKDCVESNLYQSRQFDAGNHLAKALSGDISIQAISPRIKPKWKKDILFLLQSKIETGYLLISSDVFTTYPNLDEVLHVFQRICRFALKTWNAHSFASTEKWNPNTDCGVIFPFPISKQTGFRVTLRRGYQDPRVAKRHGSRHLFAFAGGVDLEPIAGPEQARLYKKAFEELSSVRTELEVVIRDIASVPPDSGYHPLILTDNKSSNIKYQTYDQWVNRLTVSQRDFVTSGQHSPQRVEGPAGTGKTLCLLLRGYYLCATSAERQDECRVLFIAHSEATKGSISTALGTLGEPFFHQRLRADFLQTIELCTLQEWCGNLLGAKEISNAQYLDQDALEAKEMRKLILSDIVKSRLMDDKDSLKYLSEECRVFFEKEALDYVAELLQHEIGVLIKGRASENLETYLNLPSLTYCLPVLTSNDRRFIFSLYKEYQQQLNQSGVFDTDDIVLTSLGRLATPIWRRRKATEGYDAVIIDETHLFNLNELSVFHHILRNEQSFIAFSIDRSQAPGERGITTRLVKEVLTASSAPDVETKTQVVFRCSPAIVRLAEAVTSAGATLFTTFENPLIDVSSVMPASEEDVAEEPIYWECRSDGEMCKLVVKRSKEIRKTLKCRPSDILIIGTTQELIANIETHVKDADEKYIQILHRGDLETVRQGIREGALILSHPDFVGGLEFKAVLIVGVDEGRLPPSEDIKMPESRHFMEFKALNRLYVAITRARLAVELFYSNERGSSSVLAQAVVSQAIKIVSSP